MTAECATFDLPAVMKLEECQQLHEFLHAHVGNAVALNCGSVKRMGGMAAQMVQMAAQAWDHDGIAFTLSDPTDDCVDCLTTLGLETLLTHNRSV